MRARRLGGLIVTATLIAGTALVTAAGPVSATVTTDAAAAAAAASAAGYRTGIAVLNLSTGEYVGAGDDTGSFASESVVKVMIATELLAKGEMTGDTEAMAYQMITQSDDDDADALYGLAGGDDVINLVAARYNISFLGTPPDSDGYWGNTEISAKGMVYLYAAIAKDPVVGPWLMNAMANAEQYGADGTYQFFGIPSATTGAAIKQGWGDDGDDSPNAVFNSTGYVDSDKYAVAILTDGSPSTYGTAISNMLTTEAKLLMPNGQLDNPADHNPVVSNVAATAIGNEVVISGTATDPDTGGAVPIAVYEGDGQVASGSTAAGGSDFAIGFSATDGAHTYTVVVDNIGEGTANASASAAALTVDGESGGSVSSITAGVGRITVSGVASDPDLTDGQLPQIVVSVDGATTLNGYATGVASGDGSVTDYAFTLSAPASPGVHHVDVSILSAGPDQPDLAGSWTVDVAATDTHRDDHGTVMLAASVGLVGLLALLAGGGLWWRRARRSTP